MRRLTTHEVGAIARHLVTRYATSYELSVAYSSAGVRSLLDMLVARDAIPAECTWCATYRALEALTSL